MSEQPEWREAWERFKLVVEGRLSLGYVRHGDSNLATRPLHDVLDEIEEEAADIAGWMVPLHARICHLMEKAKRAEEVVESDREWLQEHRRRCTGD